MPLDADATYTVHAIRYGHMAERTRHDNLVPVDAHDGPMPMDFFVWLLRSRARTVLVDTGFSQATARVRNRERVWQRCPIDALAALDVAPEAIDDVVITHLHYDHAGNLAKIPRARLHVQDGEMDYATGRCMCHAAMRQAYHVDDVVDLVRLVYKDRVVFHQGDAPLAPGIELLAIGGHTKGLQSVRVRTARGWIVLASDAAHYYENAQAGRLFPIVYSVPQMLDGHRRLLELAGSIDHFVPGHDPLVLQRYPRLPQDDGIVELHRAPLR
jgi:glyoxylase-like metal-dependent hydrolase (beta-lactamase superfamily II)